MSDSSCSNCSRPTNIDDNEIYAVFENVDPSVDISIQNLRNHTPIVPAFLTQKANIINNDNNSYINGSIKINEFLLQGNGFFSEEEKKNQCTYILLTIEPMALLSHGCVISLCVNPNNGKILSYKKVKNPFYFNKNGGKYDNLKNKIEIKIDALTHNSDDLYILMSSDDLICGMSKCQNNVHNHFEPSIIFYTEKILDDSYLSIIDNNFDYKQAHFSYFSIGNLKFNNEINNNGINKIILTNKELDDYLFECFQSNKRGSPFLNGDCYLSINININNYDQDKKRGIVKENFLQTIDIFFMDEKKKYLNNIDPNISKNISLEKPFICSLTSLCGSDIVQPSDIFLFYDNQIKISRGLFYLLNKNLYDVKIDWYVGILSHSFSMNKIFDEGMILNILKAFDLKYDNDNCLIKPNNTQNKFKSFFNDANNLDNWGLILSIIIRSFTLYNAQFPYQSDITNIKCEGLENVPKITYEYINSPFFPDEKKDCEDSSKAVVNFIDNFIKFNIFDDEKIILRKNIIKIWGKLPAMILFLSFHCLSQYIPVCTFNFASEVDFFLPKKQCDIIDHHILSENKSGIKTSINISIGVENIETYTHMGASLIPLDFFVYLTSTKENVSKIFNDENIKKLEKVYHSGLRVLSLEGTASVYADKNRSFDDFITFSYKNSSGNLVNQDNDECIALSYVTTISALKIQSTEIWSEGNFCKSNKKPYPDNYFVYISFYSYSFFDKEFKINKNIKNIFEYEINSSTFYFINLKDKNNETKNLDSEKLPATCLYKGLDYLRETYLSSSNKNNFGDDKRLIYLIGSDNFSRSNESVKNFGIKYNNNCSVFDICNNSKCSYIMTIFSIDKMNNKISEIQNKMKNEKTLFGIGLFSSAVFNSHTNINIINGFIDNIYKKSLSNDSDETNEKVKNFLKDGYNKNGQGLYIIYDPTIYTNNFRITDKMYCPYIIVYKNEKDNMDYKKILKFLE